MKIKVKKLSYDEVLAIKPKALIKPKKPNILWRTLLKLVSLPDLLAVKFHDDGKLRKLVKKEPSLILMNHSSFLDLEMIVSMVYPNPMNIVCTTDGFIGRNWLLREIGCIPTRKFTTDPQLVKKMINAIRKYKSSVLMYPEAGYSIDGTSTTLPDNLGKLVKMLKVPVVSVITKGAYHRQPLYNNLIKRKLKASAKTELLISKEEVEKMSEAEIQKKIEHCFSFDNWLWQQENGVVIDHKDRALGLNRFLYKCPLCEKEGNMITEGATIRCPNCGKTYELSSLGKLQALEGETKFSHIPDWYKWERECVCEEILAGKYEIKVDVDIFMMIDTYNVYSLGEGSLTHNLDGFKLEAFDGKLKCDVPANKTYSINADFYWYQIDDVVTINDSKNSYFCFPKTDKDVVAKMRLAAEELYKIKNNNSK